MKVGDCSTVLNVLFLELEDYIKEGKRERSTDGRGKQRS